METETNQRFLRLVDEDERAAQVDEWPPVEQRLERRDVDPSAMVVILARAILRARRREGGREDELGERGREGREPGAVGVQPAVAAAVEERWIAGGRPAAGRRASVSR